MKQAPRTFKTRIRVRYAETDQMGVVYHANYLVWFEVGRVEMLRALGLTYRQMEADAGCALPVVEVNCRYRAPARYDDLLELETRLIAMRGPVLKFSYQLRRLEPGDDQDALLAEAVTTHIVVDRTMSRRALPEAYSRLMRDVLAPLADRANLVDT